MKNQIEMMVAKTSKNKKEKNAVAKWIESHIKACVCVWERDREWIGIGCIKMNIKHA